MELGNLFPTETYGNGCGGTCGRYGCAGACVTEAWWRYFSTTYDWPRREAPEPASGGLGGGLGGGTRDGSDAGKEVGEVILRTVKQAMDLQSRVEHDDGLGGGDLGGGIQPAFSGGDEHNAGGLVGPGHPVFSGGSDGAVARPLPGAVPPGARYDPVNGGGVTGGRSLGPTPDHLRMPEDHDV